MPKGIYPRRNPAERFWSKVLKTDGCWEWIGGRDSDGYGYFSYFVNKKQVHVRAHRYSWEIANAAPVPVGMLVLHSCDNPPCVNPAHLSAGTVADNNRDMMRKGRAIFPRGEASGKTSLTNRSVAEIRRQYFMGAVLQSELASKFGVSRASICRIVNNRRWV